MESRKQILAQEAPDFAFRPAALGESLVTSMRSADVPQS